MREGLGQEEEHTQGNRGCAGPLLGRNNEGQSGGHMVDTQQAGGPNTPKITVFRGSPSGGPPRAGSLNLLVTNAPHFCLNLLISDFIVRLGDSRTRGQKKLGSLYL